MAKLTHLLNLCTPQELLVYCTAREPDFLALFVDYAARETDLHKKTHKNLSLGKGFMSYFVKNVT